MKYEIEPSPKEFDGDTTDSMIIINGIRFYFNKAEIEPLLMPELIHFLEKTTWQDEAFTISKDDYRTGKFGVIIY